MELRETSRHPIEAIQIWRPQYLVAHARQISHPLIIGHHQDDVGAGPRKRLRRKAICGKQRNETEGNEKNKTGNWGTISHEEFSAIEAERNQGSVQFEALYLNAARGPTCFAAMDLEPGSSCSRLETRKRMLTFNDEHRGHSSRWGAKNHREGDRKERGRKGREGR